MSETAYFDANATFGRACARLPGAPYDMPGLIDELDHCRISRALVFNAAARELDSRRANRELAEQLAGENRLLGQAVISPAPYGRDRDLADELDEWLELGFRAFRVFPLWHGADLAGPRMSRVLSALAEKKLPLWVDYDQFWYNFRQLGQHEQRSLNLAEIHSLASDYPDLPLVPVGANWTHHTRLFRLLDEVENVLVETSLMQGFEAISYICRNWGAERLLFGTGMPVSAPGAARAALAYADISGQERAQVAAGNLAGLLGQPETHSLPEQAGRSPLLAAADRGEPLLERIEIFDCHGHIAPVGVDGILGLSLGPQDADSIVRRLDRIGIKSLCVSSWEIQGGDALKGNLLAADGAESHPGRILPYAVVNSNYPEDWDRLVEECFVSRDFFGFKPYPTSQRRAISDPAFREMLKMADRRRLPILCHFGFEPLAGVSPGELRLLAPLYPGAQFLIAHAGASHRLADSVTDLAVEFDNVWLEINYTSVPFGMISHLIRNAGVEKILFGTDTPMRDPAPILGWVLYDHLDDIEREAVLGGNFMRLIERTGYKLR
ncbi:MAG: amidohydrolase family protein [Candidatus Glassbacteria bacterium]|nr:amidohydrolase family protein [Candidatus Glassbacteria bacterium]